MKQSPPPQALRELTEAPSVREQTKIGFNFIGTEMKDEWLTPPELIKSLGEFDLDPCAPINRPWEMAKRHFTIMDNGLSQPWEGRVWLNPPYGRETFKWIERLSEHPDGGIALIFARTDTKGFHREIWNKAHGVFFLEGRINFYKVDGTKSDRANAPSCLVAYNEKDCNAMADSGLAGHIVFPTMRLPRCYSFPPLCPKN